MMHILLSFLILGCGGDKATQADVDEPQEPETDQDDSGEVPSDDDTAAEDCEIIYPVTWDGWAGGFFATYCRACHSVSTPNRQGAPEGVDFDTQADVDRQIDSIWRVVLDQERMPVGGGVYPDDLLLIEQYLCSRLD